MNFESTTQKLGNRCSSRRTWINDSSDRRKKSDVRDQSATHTSSIKHSPFFPQPPVIPTATADFSLTTAFYLPHLYLLLLTKPWHLKTYHHRILPPLSLGPTTNKIHRTISRQMHFYILLPHSRHPLALHGVASKKPAACHLAIFTAGVGGGVAKGTGERQRHHQIDSECANSNMINKTTAIRIIVMEVGDTKCTCELPVTMTISDGRLSRLISKR
ncbi:hypothetical protein LXL04_014205 [Taraxacum kok-saghyz]